jgi:hypothetical protein
MPSVDRLRIQAEYLRENENLVVPKLVKVAEQLLLLGKKR